MPVTFYSVIPSEAKRSRGISSCSFFYEEIRDVSTMLDMTEERWHGHVCFRRNIGLRPVRLSDILSDVSNQRITNPLGAQTG